MRSRLYKKVFNDMLPYNKNNVAIAKTLRKNMTKEERRLWYDFLKKLPYTVKRQHNIENYIVDFYIAQKKIVIELDGVQHTSDTHVEEDNKRDLELAKWGIKVLRYTNKQINQQFGNVATDILNHLELTIDDIK